MTSAKPSLELLRSLTEEHILRAIMAGGRLTRAEISARTGISKPTISEGVRRLEESGVVIDTGDRSTGRGRAGTYYTLSDACGVGLVCTIAPGAVVAETVDPFGASASRVAVELDRSPGQEGAGRALAQAAGQAVTEAERPVRTTIVSAADPVDRKTGRLVQLPDAPFMVGALDPPAVLGSVVNSEVLVDNDVNWAARAERAIADMEDPDNFVYLHLGEGLGCAVVCDGEVWRGHGGLAGEIAHVFTPGPDGDAVRFTEVFGQLGLRREGTTSIDVDKLLAAFAHQQDEVATLDRLSVAVASVISAAIALADPSTAVIGGTWGRDPRFVAALQKRFSDAPRALPIVRSQLDDEADFSGARAACLERLQDVIVGSIPGT